MHLYEIYIEGKGVPKDEEEAKKWLVSGAEHGNASCQNNLGYNFRFGENGFPKDGGMAIYWFEKAANQGFALSAGHVASMYDEGDMIKQDITKAIYWYQKASDLGDRMAKYYFAQHYRYGDGVAVDKVQAFNLTRESAELGFVPAQIELGLMFEKGEGCLKDSGAAIYWYKKAHNNSEADEEDKKFAISFLNQILDNE